MRGKANMWEVCWDQKNIKVLKYSEASSNRLVFVFTRYLNSVSCARKLHKMCARWLRKSQWKLRHRNMQLKMCRDILLALHKLWRDDDSKRRRTSSKIWFCFSRESRWTCAPNLLFFLLETLECGSLLKGGKCLRHSQQRETSENTATSWADDDDVF